MCSTAARLIAYVVAVALFAILGIAPVESIARHRRDGTCGHGRMARGLRSASAFAVSQFDSSGKSEVYEVLRHPAGGRKDIMRWGAAGERPVAELELYRPGAELSEIGTPVAEVAARMDPGGLREVVGEGIIDTKFGPVALLGLADRLKDSQRCLGFVKHLDLANLRISGWSCQGDSLPARRAAIACTLNRLVLLTAGNEPKLQEAFAQAELKRPGCVTGAAVSAASADWVTGAQNPLLRGSL